MEKYLECLGPTETAIARHEQVELVVVRQRAVERSRGEDQAPRRLARQDRTAAMLRVVQTQQLTQVQRTEARLRVPLKTETFFMFLLPVHVHVHVLNLYGLIRKCILDLVSKL